MDEINGDVKTEVEDKVEETKAVELSIAQDLDDFADQLLTDDFDE